MIVSLLHVTAASIPPLVNSVFLENVISLSNSRRKVQIERLLHFLLVDRLEQVPWASHKTAQMAERNGEDGSRETG